jgi:hypothetical protein
MSSSRASVHVLVETATKLDPLTDWLEAEREVDGVHHGPARMESSVHDGTTDEDGREFEKSDLTGKNSSSPRRIGLSHAKYDKSTTSGELCWMRGSPDDRNTDSCSYA